VDVESFRRESRKMKNVSWRFLKEECLGIVGARFFYRPDDLPVHPTNSASTLKGSSQTFTTGTKLATTQQMSIIKFMQ